MNALCETLGIDVPIVAFSHCRDVVAAVTKAGGLGVLGAVLHTPEMLEIDLAWIDKEVGGRSYGVDLIIPAKYIGKDQGGLSQGELRDLLPQRHLDFVDDLLTKYGVPTRPHDEEAPSGMLSWSEEAARPLVDIAFAHPIRLIANALGPPPSELIDQSHDRGVIVAALAGTPTQAERQVDTGVDIVIAQGYEAGGHTGDIGTMVLVPEVVDAVAPVPVLAAGGIANGRQMLAAMALGAKGVWTGSVWLTTQEAETHPVVKEKLLAASISDTVRSRSRTGKPARQLKSAWTDEWEAPGAPEPLPMPLQWMLAADAQDRIDRTAASNEGSAKLVNYFAGQVVGSIRQEKSTRRVMLDLVEEFAQAVTDVVQLANDM